MRKTSMFVVCLLVVMPLATIAQKQKSIKRLKQGLEDIQRSQRDAKRRLGKTKTNIVSTKHEMVALESNLQKVSGELDSTNDQLEQERWTQGRLKTEYENATKDVNAKKVQVARRLKAIYKQGKPNVLEFVFGSRSSADLSTREFIANRVQVADRKLFEGYKSARDAAKVKKLEQDEVVARVASLQRQQESKRQELASAQKAKESYLHNLENKKEDLQGVLDELESDAAAIESEIKVAIARAKAAEKRRMAEAKKKGEIYTPPKHSGGLVRPTAGSVTSGFGSRYHPILHYNRMHSGVDFGGGHGAPVYAAGAGTVIAASTRGGYGNCVIIDHGNGMSTVYGHLSKIMVSEGQNVTSHQRVGSIGSTGLATGPHLHFEVRVNGRAVNPMGYL